jgi:hypothetical protein
MRIGRILVATVVLVLGVAAILLADDVRSWRNTLHDDAVAYSAFPSQRERLTAPTMLPAGVAGRLLAVDHDRQWLRALPLFTRVEQATRNITTFGRVAYAALNGGRAVLGTVTHDPNPARASQAYNLLALLAFREAHSGGETDQALLQEAVTELQNAVRLDGSNEKAKANLELALRIVTAAQREQQRRAVGLHQTNKRQGAFGYPAGTGY